MEETIWKKFQFLTYKAEIVPMLFELANKLITVLLLLQLVNHVEWCKQMVLILCVPLVEESVWLNLIDMNEL